MKRLKILEILEDWKKNNRPKTKNEQIKFEKKLEKFVKTFNEWENMVWYPYLKKISKTHTYFEVKKLNGFLTMSEYESMKK